MKKRYDLFINVHYYETFKTKEEAERAIEKEKRHDRNEVVNEGYLPIEIKYEIKEEK